VAGCELPNSSVVVVAYSYLSAAVPSGQIIFPVALMANWLNDEILPTNTKIGSTQLAIIPMDRIQMTHPDKVPAVACFMIYPPESNTKSYNTSE
jgi:hypothetical protein